MAEINIEETPDKIVGKRRTITNPLSLEGSRKEDARAWENALPRTHIPKGVYRFKTHEEADAWMEHHIIQAALKKARARQDEPT